MANTYGLNFIKIGGISIFREGWGGGQKPPIRWGGGLHVTCDAHVRTRTRDDVCEHMCEVSCRSRNKVCRAATLFEYVQTYVRADPYIPCKGIINP